ncbi:Glycosyltransferase involved in cell wall bisynthesis [Pseudacidovorax sp. RU35E]|nr:Glycosyltransferase involved in cell wall bisynthesis [Pseudacidovorax sp. RU35E]
MFPPPLNGMSAVTSMIHSLLVAYGSENVETIDCSPKVYRLRTPVARARKFIRIIGLLYKFHLWCISREGGKIYLSVSGRLGQIYDLLFVCIARFHGKNVYLHHHGYLYIERKNFLASILFKVAGKSAIHIAACEKMALELANMYSIISNTRVISGVICLPEVEKVPSVRAKLRTVGFLSNISAEKGIFEFIDSAIVLSKVFPELNFIIAGQFQDASSERAVTNFIQQVKSAHYVGPVYGNDKTGMLDSIDCLLFPTHTESEGLVIHEAHSRCVPVIARSTGCIASFNEKGLNLTASDATDFVEQAVAIISKWISVSEDFLKLSAKVYHNHLEFRKKNDKAVREIVKEIAIER